MIVCIGMLAYNEASRIEGTLKSLFDQSIFTSRASASSIAEWQIVVVPNGCSDATATVARETLEAWARNAPAPMSFTVAELPKGDKCGAWNHFVHEVSRRDADVLILLDADIEFGHPDTILNCLALLRDQPHVHVAVDAPLKSVARKARPTLRERLSLRQSQRTAQAVAVSGQFYCARAQSLRDIWMPLGMPVEDGYVLGMIVTDCFRGAVDLSRVARPENASHYYEALTTIRELIHHETRITVGTAMNAYLMWDFLRFATAAGSAGAGALVRTQMQADPDWYRSLMQNQIQARGWWVLPGGMLGRRFHGLRGKSLVTVARRLPLAVAAFLLDIPILISANQRLRGLRGVGFW